MWLVVSLACALGASAAYFWLPAVRGRYRLGFLALMLWGMATMVLADHSIAYLEGGQFIEVSTDGLIESGTLLGVAMLAPILLIWAAATFTPLGKRVSVG